MCGNTILSAIVLACILVCGVTVQAEMVIKTVTVGDPGNGDDTHGDGFGRVGSRDQSTPSFQPLGDLPGGDVLSVAAEGSADGSVVVGQSGSTTGYEAFRWTEANGMIGLGDLFGSPMFVDSSGHGVSADGSVVVGQALSASGGQAFLWTQAEGMVGLGDLTGGSFLSSASDVSPDGSVVVGYGNSASGQEAFRWTEAEGMVGLGDLPGGTFRSSASSVSADGSVVVGASKVGSSGLEDEYEAFRWTETEGMVGLDDLPDGEFNSSASAVSADGTVVVGFGTSASGQEAFRWTEAEGMVGLGDLPGGTFGSGASSVSADGSIVLGVGTSDSGWEAFVWDRVNGMRNLRDVLANDLGLNLTGWTKLYVGNVSADGHVIIGDGTNPSGDLEAWRVVLPCAVYTSGCLGDAIPTISEWGMVAMALLVLTAGTLVLAHRRRVSRGAG